MASHQTTAEAATISGPRRPDAAGLAWGWARPGSPAVVSIVMLGAVVGGGLATAVSGGPLWLRIASLLTGLVVVAAGTLIPWARSVQLLLFGTAATWFLADVIPGVAGAHRGALLAAGALVWVSPGRLRALVLALGCLAVVPVVDALPWFWVATVAVVLVGSRHHVEWVLPLAALLVLHAQVVSMRLVEPETAQAISLGYDTLMVAAAGAIAFWLSRLNRMDALADRIDHGGTHLERLQRILSETLADPELTLTVGGGAGGADGMVVATLAGEVAVQSRALRDEPLLRAPIREAIVLSYAHEHLRGMLASTLGSTQAAGRRLLVADDVQRAALADRILSGPVPLLERAHQELALSGTTAVEPALLRLELATGELRSFGEGVLPPLASGVDLAVALRSLASTMPGSLVVELTTVPVAADQVVAQTLYYVCAEALANVMRHSGATQVDIELTDNAQGIALSVRDNGLGVTGDPRQGSSGLAGLADRLRILGGRLELEDRPGGGAALVAEVPR